MTINASIRKQAIDLYRDGKPSGEIAVQLGISRASVRVFARSADLPSNQQVPPGDKKSIIQCSRNGEKLHDIALRFNISECAAIRIAKSGGAPFGHCRYPEATKRKAVALYLKIKSTIKVARSIGVSPAAVSKWMKAAEVLQSCAEVGMRKASSHPLRWGELTPERAWILGVIYGDGGIKRDRSELTITISLQDEDVLQKIMAILGHWPKLFRREGSARLTVSSKMLVADLTARFGLDHEKAASLAWPAIDRTLHPHFVRGLLDSDGCWHQRIGRQNRQLLFSYASISHRFVKDLEGELFKNINICPQPVRLIQRISHLIKGRVLVSKPISCITYAHLDCIEIGQWLYAGETEHMRCERKYCYWLERSTAMVKPHWIKRHESHRDRERARRLLTDHQ